jgi:hypothetical protein
MIDRSIVFCITCKGRAQHIKQTLPRNLADNANYPNCKFVLLDYNSQDGLLEYLQTVHELTILNGYLNVYSYREDVPFHVAHAKNIAARLGILEGADILVTLDADNFTGHGFARFINEKFNESGIFLCPDFPLIHSLPHGPLRPARGYAGRLAIRAQDFVKAGGYDEIFSTWRGEDMDLIYRLERMGYTMRHIDNRYLETIPHSSEVRFREYPHARQYENKHEARVLSNRVETVVNFGKFGLGTVFKNFGSNPTELKAVPTRVFGIGMHKTATNSLHKAFQILGFDSLHWGNGEAPLIWHEMTSPLCTCGHDYNAHFHGHHGDSECKTSVQYGATEDTIRKCSCGNFTVMRYRSKTLERWYSLCDLPIPLLYQKLDRAYPGSKFILTIRDEEKWLKSISRLWDPRYNPTRYLWDIYPISNQLHSALYGQKDFNPDVMLEIYRRHNIEVLEYFKDRPQDLLVMNMEGNDHWAALSGFLDKPIPQIPYPLEYVSKVVSKGVLSCSM